MPVAMQSGFERHVTGQKGISFRCSYGQKGKLSGDSLSEDQDAGSYAPIGKPQKGLPQKGSGHLQRTKAQARCRSERRGSGT